MEVTIENQKPEVGGWIKVVKNGQYFQNTYKVGDILQISKHYLDEIVDVGEGNTMMRISISANVSTYGQEAIYLGMEKPVEEPNYQIF